MIGNIPEKLVYFTQPAEEVSTNWDDIESNSINTLNVYPTYVSDAKNKKTLETGENWAKGYRNNKKPGKIELENVPLTDIRIIGLEIRSQGGRAYKVVIDNKYYVDLREDVLLETMIECGIEKGAKLNGEFVWAKVGSQMKLVRVGSELHSELVKATALDNTKPIKQLDLYGMYRNKKGDQFIYMGRVNTTDIQYDVDCRSSRYWANENDLIKITKMNNVHCFLELPTFFKDKELSDVIKCGYYFKFQKSFIFKEKVKDVKIPDNWKDLLKKGILHSIEDEKKNYRSSDANMDSSYFCYSQQLNIDGIHPKLDEISKKYKIK